MPQVIDILRLRRKRDGQNVWGSGGGLIFRAILGSLSLLVLVGVFVIAVLQSQVTADLPSVTTLENHFGSIGRDVYEPVRFFDRDGDTILFEVINPQATGARWLYIQEDGPIDIQEHTLRAFLAAVDPDYFSRPAPTILEMVRDFFMQWLQGSAPTSSAYIPQALVLVEAQLMPLGMIHLPDNIQLARIHLLEQELSRQYSKSQILEWLVNSADFGHDMESMPASLVWEKVPCWHLLFCSHPSILLMHPRRVKNVKRGFSRRWSSWNGYRRRRRGWQTGKFSRFKTPKILVARHFKKSLLNGCKIGLERKLSTAVV
jgi:hypothetical protein